jgi:hypothetical protein
MWNTDSIWIQAMLWKTGHIERSLMGDGGQEKDIKKVSTDVLSIQEWI